MLHHFTERRKRSNTNHEKLLSEKHSMSQINQLLQFQRCALIRRLPSASSRRASLPAAGYRRASPHAGQHPGG